MRNIVVPVEFTPTAHALLKAVALSDGHDSVAALLNQLALRETLAFAEALADEQRPELQQIFTVNQTDKPRL